MLMPVDEPASYTNMSREVLPGTLVVTFGHNPSVPITHMVVPNPRPRVDASYIAISFVPRRRRSINSLIFSTKAPLRHPG